MDVPTSNSIDPEPQLIAGDVRCVRCGYSLRGLRSDGRCPECGAEIHASVEGGYYASSDPLWVQRLALGVDLNIAFVAVFLLDFLVLWGYMRDQIPLAWSLGRPELIVGAFLLALAGVWLLTTGDPGQQSSAPGDWRRTWLRAIACVAFALACLPLPIYSILSYLDERLSQFVRTALGIACATLYWLHVRSIARLADEPAVLRHGPVVFWGFMLSVLLGEVLPTLEQTGLVPARRQSYPITPETLAMMLGLGMLVYGAWVLLSLRHRLHRLAATARDRRVPRSTAAPDAP